MVVTFADGGIRRYSWLIIDGIVIFVNDEHPEKAEYPILVTEKGIAICVNDEHPEKAYSPIEVTQEGIVICFSDEHL